MIELTMKVLGFGLMTRDVTIKKDITTF